jgi:hypothetical protein
VIFSFSIEKIIISIDSPLTHHPPINRGAKPLANCSAYIYPEKPLAMGDRIRILMTLPPGMVNSPEWLNLRVGLIDGKGRPSTMQSLLRSLSPTAPPSAFGEVDITHFQYIHIELWIELAWEGESIYLWLSRWPEERQWVCYADRVQPVVYIPSHLSHVTLTIVHPQICMQSAGSAASKPSESTPAESAATCT